MKVAITGGTGFIGLNLARHLLKQETIIGPDGTPQEIDAITLFDAHLPDQRPDGLDERAELIQGDISDPDVISNLIDRDDISVFHFASVVSAGGEKDFDSAIRVNLKGGQNILEACRSRSGTPRVVFASSFAVFGGDAMPDEVTDNTKITPETTYGMTKAIGELMINDYSRKGFLDGRSARLPTIIIRPGKPNAAASSYASGLFREPLSGNECQLPVRFNTRMPLLGYRNCIAGILKLHELEGSDLGSDRAVNLPARDYTPEDMIAALKTVAKKNGIVTGPINLVPDEAIQRIIDSWPKSMKADRAIKLGLPEDENLEKVIQDFMDDFGI